MAAAAAAAAMELITWEMAPGGQGTSECLISCGGAVRNCAQLQAQSRNQQIGVPSSTNFLLNSSANLLSAVHTAVFCVIIFC